MSSFRAGKLSTVRRDTAIPTLCWMFWREIYSKMGIIFPNIKAPLDFNSFRFVLLKFTGVYFYKF